jgi:hypothetical protein
MGNVQIKKSTQKSSTVSSEEQCPENLERAKVMSGRRAQARARSVSLTGRRRSGVAESDAASWTHLSSASSRRTTAGESDLVSLLQQQLRGSERRHDDVSRKSRLVSRSLRTEVVQSNLDAERVRSQLNLLDASRSNYESENDIIKLECSELLALSASAAARHELAMSESAEDGKGSTVHLTECRELYEAEFMSMQVQAHASRELNERLQIAAESAEYTAARLAGELDEARRSYISPGLVASGFNSSVESNDYRTANVSRSLSPELIGESAHPMSLEQVALGVHGLGSVLQVPGGIPGCQYFGIASPDGSVSLGLDVRHCPSGGRAAPPPVNR